MIANQALDIALNEVRHNIPREILELVYVKSRLRNIVGAPNQAIAPCPYSWEQGVIDDVVCGRVLPCINITGGKVKEISLLSTYIETTSVSSTDWMMGMSPYSIYRIPPEERDNVPIVAVMGITPPVQLGNGLGILNAGGTNGPLQAARAMLDSYTLQSFVQTPAPELLAGDLIRISPSLTTPFDWVVHVRLAYDLNLLALQLSAILPFAELVLCAVKANIYTRTIIAIDQGLLQFGQELNAIRGIIDSYGTANDRYQELLTAFTGGATIDPKRLAFMLGHAL